MSAQCVRFFVCVVVSRLWLNRKSNLVCSSPCGCTSEVLCGLVYSNSFVSVRVDVPVKFVVRLCSVVSGRIARLGVPRRCIFRNLFLNYQEFHHLSQHTGSLVTIRTLKQIILASRRFSHDLYSLGCWRAGQDPAAVEALLPEHAGAYLRGGLER